MTRPVILQIITKSELGGAQSHVADLIEGLSASQSDAAFVDESPTKFLNNCEVHLATGQDGPLVERAKKAGAQVHFLPQLQRAINPLSDVGAVRECADLVREIRPDLIHAHSSKAGIVARLAGRATKVPTVFTAHGWGFSPGTPPARRALAWAFEYAVAPLGSRIICVSEADRRLALRHNVGTRRSLVVIRYGIPPEAAQATPQTEPPRFIMVARFNEQKDQTTLLHALAELQKSPDAHPDFTVDFVGSGPDFEKVQTLAHELGVFNKVSFLGDRHDVPELLRRSQCFILSTHYEGLPISIMEAMRAGLPIIATNVSGVREEVAHGENGYLVPHLDAPALARALQKLTVDEAKREQMGAASRAKFLNEFTRARMLGEIDALYTQVTASKAT